MKTNSPETTRAFAQLIDAIRCNRSHIAAQCCKKIGSGNINDNIYTGFDDESDTRMFQGTALEYACARQSNAGLGQLSDAEMVETLIGNGAAVTQRALYLACCVKEAPINYDVVQVLLQKGIRPVGDEILLILETSPNNSAIRMESARSISLLLESGSNPFRDGLIDAAVKSGNKFALEAIIHAREKSPQARGLGFTERLKIASEHVRARMAIKAPALASRMPGADGLLFDLKRNNKDSFVVTGAGLSILAMSTVTRENMVYVLAPIALYMASIVVGNVISKPLKASGPFIENALQWMEELTAPYRKLSSLRLLAGEHGQLEVHEELNKDGSISLQFHSDNADITPKVARIIGASYNQATGTAELRGFPEVDYYDAIDTGLGIEASMARKLSMT